MWICIYNAVYKWKFISLYINKINKEIIFSLPGMILEVILKGSTQQYKTMNYQQI